MEEINTEIIDMFEPLLKKVFEVNPDSTTRKNRVVQKEEEIDETFI